MTQGNFDSGEKLQSLRDEIALLDQNILELVEKRLQRAEDVGKIKLQKSSPIKNFQVEKQVYARNQGCASKLGVDLDLADSISRLLIQHSIAKQQSLFQKHAPKKKPDGERIAILGASGGMGKWLSRFFRSSGFEVFDFDQENEEAFWGRVQEFNYIWIAVPMPSTPGVLSKLAASGTKAVVVEICSYKNHIFDLYKSIRSRGLQICSLHPMFGPDAEVLAGKKLVVCEYGDEPFVESVLEFFETTSLDLVRIPLAKHDEHMNYVLSASHLVNIIFAYFLHESDLGIDRLRELAGTTFQEQLRVTQKVCADNMGLYFDIQVLNPHVKSLFKTLKNNFDRLEQMFLSNQKPEFLTKMDAVQFDLGKARE